MDEKVESNGAYGLIVLVIDTDLLSLSPADICRRFVTSRNGGAPKAFTQD
jgi:hypothetical protein